MHKEFTKINQTDLKYLKSDYNKTKMIREKQYDLKPHFKEVRNPQQILSNTFFFVKI